MSEFEQVFEYLHSKGHKPEKTYCTVFWTGWEPDGNRKYLALKLEGIGSILFSGDEQQSIVDSVVTMTPSTQRYRVPADGSWMTFIGQFPQFARPKT
jgi:hypothetical protein